MFYPPAANMSPKKLTGTSFIEYEPGKRAWHGPGIYDAISGDGHAFSMGLASRSCQIAMAGKKLVFVNAGKSMQSGVDSSKLYYIHSDGSTDHRGMHGSSFTWGGHLNPILAASPDGKWVYMVSHGRFSTTGPVVLRAPADGSKTATVFAGVRGKPGSDNAHLNGPRGIDCDAKGRVYVADAKNNRIQIFSPEGKFLKTVKMGGLRLVRIHQKTGAIYVQHSARVKGRSVARLTKLKSFDNLVEEFHVDGIGSELMTLDSWSKKPRLWLANNISYHHGKEKSSAGLKVYEETGGKLRLLFDFAKDVRKEDGKNYMGRWSGGIYDKVVCDPTREQVYYGNSRIFDLKSGKRVGSFRPGRHCRFDDMAFDKYGFMHVHFNPCFFGQGIGRMDPEQAVKDKNGALSYPEIPYNYGVEKLGWVGVISTKDQNGPKGFQDGLGVNMKGDVVSECNIYYMPKMEEAGWGLVNQGVAARKASGVYVDSGVMDYAKFMRQIQDKQKRGEDVYFIKRRPGIPLAGGTAWTYERSGELLKECAVVGGDLINGVQMDEDRSLYFVNSRIKLVGGKAFLFGKGGSWGGKAGQHPFTGTVIKTKAGQKCSIILPNAPVPMDPLPKRPPEILATDFMVEVGDHIKGSRSWVEGAEWLYAGASPITAVGCSCPRQHLGLDWYKRVLVPEAYRHSIGILDTNGNLIMHLGSYGNFDDAPGGKDGAKPGGEDIKIMMTRFISATDNYLVYGDWGEKLVVLKLDYHAEESVKIKVK